MRLDLIWTLSAAKWLCEDAELRALFVSEDMEHADEYAARYMDDNLRCLDQLNPDAMSRLVATGEDDLTHAVAKRREAAGRANTIANGFAQAVENLSQQQSLSRALVEDGTSGRIFIQTASKETQSKFLFVMPK